MGARDGVWVLCDSVDNGVEDAVDEAVVAEGFGLVVAVDKSAVSFWCRNAGRVVHVMLERIVDVELYRVHLVGLVAESAGISIGGRVSRNDGDEIGGRNRTGSTKANCETAIGHPQECWRGED